jgi:hypothetical protein
MHHRMHGEFHPKIEKFSLEDGGALVGGFKPLWQI